MNPSTYASDTAKYPAAFFFFLSLAVTVINYGELPRMTEIFLAVLIGGMVYVAWWFGAYHAAIWVLMQDWKLAGAVSSYPAQPEEPTDDTPAQPVRHEARVTAEPQVTARRDSMPQSVTAVLKALDNGDIAPPLSLAKLDNIGISRSHPRPHSAAHLTLDWFRSRGIIDGSGMLTGTIPRLNELPPYPAETSLNN
jgi:hypothetical protein